MRGKYSNSLRVADLVHPVEHERQAENQYSLLNGVDNIVHLIMPGETGNEHEGGGTENEVMRDSSIDVHVLISSELSTFTMKIPGRSNGAEKINEKN